MDEQAEQPTIYKSVVLRMAEILNGQADKLEGDQGGEYFAGVAAGMKMAARHFQGLADLT